MVARHNAIRRRGLTGYKVVELLTGEIRYPLLGYTGYGDQAADQGQDSLTENYISDAMAEDWEANREQLLAFWRSGKYTMTDELAEFGFDVAMKPWLFVCGSRDSLPWAALEFDREDRLAGRVKRPRQEIGSRAQGRGSLSGRQSAVRSPRSPRLRAQTGAGIAPREGEVP
jgi:hypothetical protein